jgi:hypothetical protein
LNYSKIVSSTTKTTSAIFLAIVLIAGTIAISSSFMTNSQAQPYHEDRMDNMYNSYGPPEYPSYQPDYKPIYPSYEKDNRDKSKDSSKSVSINKIKCINNNININGVNSGDINIGNKGGVAAAEGYSGSGANSYGGEGYYDGHSKKDKGFECIINNNNTNINLVGGGNQTEQLTCEECFTENLSVEQLNNLTDVLSRAPYQNLEGLCEVLSNTTIGTNQERLVILVFIFNAAGITDEDTILRVLKCLDELGLIIVPPDFELPNSMR